MDEIIHQALGYLRGIWHRRWLGLAVAWTVAIVGVATVYRIPNKYEASARVYVDTESLIRPLLAGLAIQPNIDQQVALISRTLISRPNIEKLLRLADLDLGTHTPAERDDLVDTVMRSITLSSVGGNLYTISYRDRNPIQARNVVQSLLNIFVESSLGNKREDTQSAVKFLDDQLKRYEATLRATENKMKDFRLKYMGVNRDQDYFSRMSALTSAIEQAKLDLETAEQTRDSYKKQLAGETPVYIPETEDASADSGVTTEVDARIGALKRDLDSLLRKYTDQHPDVIATRKLIDQLEAQRKTQIEARRKAAASEGRRAQPSLDQNPVFQQLRISLADAEASVASSRAKLSGLQNQFQALKAQAQLVPEIEAEYTELSRDYDVQKRTYQSLLSRRESATMGKDVQDSGGAQFRIIDPPRVSPEPVSPNRFALLALVVLASLGAGVFASLLASQLMPTFHDARTLRDITKRPIIGMISVLPSDALNRQRRRHAWLFAGGMGGLLATFSAAFAFMLLIGRGVA